MKLRFDGRVALVTGAGKGLGRAYAEWLGERGATVIVNNRRHDGQPSSAATVVEAIRSRGGIAIADHHAVEADGAGREMVDLAIEHFGRLDIVICNAGIMQWSSADQLELSDFRAMMEVNFWGSVQPLLAALPRMYSQNYGRIVLTSSKAGLYGKPDSAHYSASKTAFLGIVRALAMEIAQRGANIRANAVAPFAYTSMTRKVVPEHVELMSPNNVAKVVAWLCSEQCTANGSTFLAGAGGIRRLVVGETPPVHIDSEDLSALMPNILGSHGLHEPKNADESVFIPAATPVK